MLRSHRQVIMPRQPRNRLTARTGSHCPLSGLWVPCGEEASPSPVLEGSIMPAYANDPVEWTLLEPLGRITGNGVQA